VYCSGWRLGTITATVNKAALPATEEFADAIANAGAVAVNRSGNNITVTGNLEDLIAFPSSNPAQGTHKWLAIDIDTNLDSIVGATWNGSALTQDDVDEAASVGLGAGHIIYWTKCDVIADTPAVNTIAKEGMEDISLTFNFVEEV